MEATAVSIAVGYRGAYNVVELTVGADCKESTCDMCRSNANDNHENLASTISGANPSAVDAPEPVADFQRCQQGHNNGSVTLTHEDRTCKSSRNDRSVTVQIALGEAGSGLPS